MYPDYLTKTARAAGEHCTSGISAEDAAKLIHALLRAIFLAGLGEAKAVATSHAEFYLSEAHYRPGAPTAAREIAKAIELRREQCLQAPWPPAEKEPALAEEEKSDA